MMIKKNNKFIERSILSVLGFFKDCLINNSFIEKTGFLQCLNPKAKVFFLLMILLLLSFTQSINKFVFLSCICLALVFLSKINLFYFLWRSLFFIPLFSLVIILPNILDVFSPGKVILSFKIFDIYFNVTQEGIHKSLIFVLRVSLSVSYVILINITTAHLRLLKAIKSFGVSALFVEIMRMTYRYIHIFVQAIENMYLAIKSRTGSNIPVHQGQKVVVWNIAAFWNRTENLNQQVFNAMLSRGYKGEVLVFEEEKLQFNDIVFLLISLILCLIIFFSKL